MARLPHIAVLLALVIATPGQSHPGHADRLALVEERIASTPFDAALYMQRGELHLEAGLLDSAHADFQHAEKLGVAPNILALHWARLYRRAGNLKDASAQVDLYLDAFAQSAAGYELRAHIAADKGDYHTAATALERHLALLQSPHPGNYLSAAEILSRLDRQDDAVKILDEGISKLGLVPSLQEKAAQLEMARGKPDQAIVRMLSLKVPLNNSAVWKLDMAELLVRSGHKEEASRLARAAGEQLQAQRATPARKHQIQRALTLEASLSPAR